MFLNINYVNLASYTYDHTIYDSGDSIDIAITYFKVQLRDFFSGNKMRGNNVKCHFIASTNNTHYIFDGNSSIKSSNCKNLLWVKIHSKLKFDDHIKDKCKKANIKLRPLARATSCMKTEQKKLWINSFFSS